MRKTTIYPAQVKASILAKALAPNAPSVVELAKEFNIPYATLYTWMSSMLNNKPLKQVNKSQRPQDKSAQDKLQAVLETMDKTEEEKSAYCRQHGIYISHLEEWKQQMLAGLGNTNKDKSDNSQTTKEIQQLKKDLYRKDKALAEASALLILKKKADLIWGESEDD